MGHSCRGEEGGEAIVKLAILLVLPLAGCGLPGISTWEAHPYYEQATGQEVCCSFRVTSGRDVAQAALDATRNVDGSLTIHYTESGVSAAAPLNANASAVVATAGAVSNVAVSAAKFSLKP